jgi:hypothetical protein
MASTRSKLVEIVASFATLEDPRSHINRRHPLPSVLVIAVLAGDAARFGLIDRRAQSRARGLPDTHRLAGVARHPPFGVASHPPFGEGRVPEHRV